MATDTTITLTCGVRRWLPWLLKGGVIWAQLTGHIPFGFVLWAARKAVYVKR